MNRHLWKIELKREIIFQRVKKWANLNVIVVARSLLPTSMSFNSMSKNTSNLYLDYLFKAK